ncbi:MAG: hypothetical protein M0Z41_05140 [Peptococcaceae bacterium]|nr:hypothetical protein [Peptococcaceae bacterium]
MEGITEVEWVIGVVGGIGVILLAGIFFLACKAFKSGTSDVELEKIISGDKWGLVHSLVIVFVILVIVLLAVVSPSLPGFQLPLVISAVLGLMGTGFAHALGKPKNPKN